MTAVGGKMAATPWGPLARTVHGPPALALNVGWRNFASAEVVSFGRR